MTHPDTIGRHHDRHFRAYITDSAYTRDLDRQETALLRATHATEDRLYALHSRSRQNLRTGGNAVSRMILDWQIRRLRRKLEKLHAAHNAIILRQIELRSAVSNQG